MGGNIITQQPQQQTMMVQKPSTPPAAPTNNVTTGRPGQTILVLQRGDTLKLDAHGNLVVVGKGDPPAGASASSSAPQQQPQQQQQQQAQPKPMNVMQHTAVQNIVQMQGTISGNQITQQQQQPARPTRVQAPVVNVPQGMVQSPQLQSMLVQQQPQPSKLKQQLTAQSQIHPQVNIQNQIAVQGRLMAKGPSESTTKGGNIFFTPSTQAPFQMVAASKAGQVVKVNSPPAVVSQMSGNAQGQLFVNNSGSPTMVGSRPATVMIKAVANTVAANKNIPVRIIDDSSLTKNSSGEVTLLQCDKCKRLFVSKESLLKHLETEKHMETSQDAQNGEKKYQCSACNETFVYKSSLTLHENRLCSKQPWTAAGQSSPYNFVCGICKLRFKFKQELEGHMARVHEGQSAPAEIAPVTVSTWGTMQVKDKPLVQQEKPPLITTIKIEPGTLPKIKSNSIGVTTPPRGRGRPRKNPAPPGTPVNKAGTVLAPEGHTFTRRGRPPKNPATSLAAALVAQAAGRKSPGRGKRKRRHSRPSIEAHDGDDEDSEVAYVVKDEKATTKYLCTTHGVYDSKNPRPHRCTICPKGFLSQHCLLEHIKTHIKPFWCSKCGWKSSRKDNVMRHIELHHAGPKYQQKRKSPSTSKKLKLEGDDGTDHVDEIQGDDDLIDYQASVHGDEDAMEENEKEEDVGGSEKTDTDGGSEKPEIQSSEDHIKADGLS